MGTAARGVGGAGGAGRGAEAEAVGREPAARESEVPGPGRSEHRAAGWSLARERDPRGGPAVAAPVPVALSSPSG